jgi:hypothetical protein
MTNEDVYSLLVLEILDNHDHTICMFPSAQLNQHMLLFFFHVHQITLLDDY